MSGSRLSTKGQVVIPKAIRDRQGWSEGTDLTFEDRGDHVVIRLSSRRRETTLDDLYGLLPWDGPAKTLDDLEAAIPEGVRQRR